LYYFWHYAKDFNRTIDVCHFKHEPIVQQPKEYPIGYSPGCRKIASASRSFVPKLLIFFLHISVININASRKP